MNQAAAAERPNEVAVIRHELAGMTEQFKSALPAHIPVERFCRVVMTALQNNPDLVRKCSRRSLWNSAMKAAQDGLLPDGREGAIVDYGGEAQWLPMIAGLRKKARNSGEIATWDAQVVHAKDAFEFELGDEPFIRHRPCLDEEPGQVIAAYSVAVLKSGEKSREVMSIAAIEKVRARSRAKKSGPWFSDFEEMCRKTVARRHSKVLPTSTDLDDLLRRDDDLYDIKGAGDAAIAGGDKHKTLAGRLDALAGPTISQTALASREHRQDGDEGAGDGDAGGAPAPAQNSGADNQPPASAQAAGSPSSAKSPAAEPEARAYRPGTGGARLSDFSDVGGK
jgi:recombination protein RecT